MQQIIAGKRAVKEAIHSELTIDRVIIQDNKSSAPEFKSLIWDCKQKKIKVQFISADVMKKTYGESAIQGVLAIGLEKAFLALSEICDHPDQHPFVLILDHIEDPYNFGALLRSAELFGANTVIYPKDRNAQLTAGVMKAASGATAHIDLVKVSNIAQSIGELKKAGFWIFGTDANNGVDLNTLKPPFPAAIVVGNESKGLSQLVSKKCDEHIRIPMTGKLSSLNVSVATGIILYHFSINYPKQ